MDKKSFEDNLKILSIDDRQKAKKSKKEIDDIMNLFSRDYEKLEKNLRVYMIHKKN